MKKSTCCRRFPLKFVLCLSSLSVLLLSGQSSASGSSEVSEDPSTLFESGKDSGSGEETGNVGPVPQRRRSSFRADLGKRFLGDWSPLEVKRPSKSSSFRSDLGKRNWELDSPMNSNFEDDLGRLVGSRYETMLSDISASSRNKRFAVGELERQVEDGGPGEWKGVGKRARSSFRADLGKRSDVDHELQEQEHKVNSEEVEGEASYDKRARHAFRGDLGKRFLKLRDGDDKRRNAFRGDLGRKRSLTLDSWNTGLPLSFSSFDGEEHLRKLIESAKGSDSDQDEDGALEKRRFRSDLG